MGAFTSKCPRPTPRPGRAWRPVPPPPQMDGAEARATYLPMLLAHMRDVGVPLCEEPVTLPASPPRACHFLGLQGPLHRRWGLLLRFVLPIQGPAVIFVLVSGVLGCGLETKRQVNAQVWRPFDAFQGSVHRLHEKRESGIMDHARNTCVYMLTI